MMQMIENNNNNVWCACSKQTKTLAFDRVLALPTTMQSTEFRFHVLSVSSTYLVCSVLRNPMPPTAAMQTPEK